ncbi:MAG: hypothetical protein LBE92_10930 [Chryseobacterium sp.]|uniref:hypothetical protein n=1 Tax=Chryseobacterium sp. TaxID=1871047 RepID=UPI0028311328|nr:hypothetical protein [Chryseobacterium sp.]MDR2236628.1 hypothetical protein [Chryseobacterium sp.]
MSTEIPNLIGKEFIIDQINPKEDKFSSKNLDQLFNKKSYTYLIGEYSGTSKENFNCKIVGLFKNNVYEKSYALFFNGNNVLKDTLNITKKDISLDVTLENNKKGVALGSFDVSDMKDTYFKITDLYEVDGKTIKLKKININQKILKCEIPIDYISEEYEGLENYFHYGITNKSVGVIKDIASSGNIVFKTTALFNNDKSRYRIEVLKNTADKDAYDQLHFNLPVKIYKGNSLWKNNDRLIFDKRNSCISEGFSTIVVKNNYFTIEHQDCSDYQLLVNAYITFKVSGNEIYLYKYGESYFDKSDHERDIPEKVWTEKDFGKIKFEEVTADFLQKLP